MRMQACRVGLTDGICSFDGEPLNSCLAAGYRQNGSHLDLSGEGEVVIFLIYDLNGRRGLWREKSSNWRAADILDVPPYFISSRIVAAYQESRHTEMKSVKCRGDQPLVRYTPKSPPANKKARDERRKRSEPECPQQVAEVVAHNGSARRRIPELLPAEPVSARLLAVIRTISRRVIRKNSDVFSRLRF